MKMNHEQAAQQAPQSADAPRRGFLGKLFVAAAALVAAPSVAGLVSAEEHAAHGKGRGGRPNGGEHDGPPSPGTVATRLIKEFDKDNDRALSHAELTAALASLHHHGQGKGNPGPGGPGRGKGNPGPGGPGRGKGKESKS